MSTVILQKVDNMLYRCKFYKPLYIKHKTILALALHEEEEQKKKNEEERRRTRVEYWTEYT